MNKPTIKLPTALQGTASPAAEGPPEGVASVLSSFGVDPEPEKSAEDPAETPSPEAEKPKAGKKGKTEKGKPKAEKKGKPKAEKKGKTEKTDSESEDGDEPADGETCPETTSFVPVDAIKTTEECDSIRSKDEFSEDALAELSASIKAHGILSPLIVEKNFGGYVLVDGHRRLAAAKLAKLAEVPVVCVDLERQTKAVAKMFGIDAPQSAMVRNVVGVVANTARAQLDEADLSRALRTLFKADKEHKLVNAKTGRANVAAVARVLGQPHGTVRPRVALVEAYNDKQIARLDEAVRKSDENPKAAPFTWSTVFHALLRPAGETREIVDAVADGKLDPFEARQQVDDKKREKGEKESGSDEGGDPGEASTKVGPKIFDGPVAVKLSGAPRVKATAMVTIAVRLEETIKDLSFDGPRGKAVIKFLESEVQRLFGEALRGQPRTKPKNMPEASFVAEVEADEAKRLAEIRAAFGEAVEAVRRKLDAAKSDD